MNQNIGVINMEKIKEFIRVNRQSALNNFHACYTKNYTDAYKANYWDGVAEGYDKSLEIIDQELQDYTFIRVPRKVKLSEIIERLKKEICKSFSVQLETILQFTKFIVIQNLDDENDTKVVDITENKIDYLENQDVTECDFFPKWLYYMYLEKTIIEVDV